jgi:hypothetical protein
MPTTVSTILHDPPPLQGLESEDLEDAAFSPTLALRIGVQYLEIAGEALEVPKAMMPTRQLPLKTPPPPTNT